jgi:hypothetical protein
VRDLIREHPLSTRGVDHERTRIEGPRACADQSADAVAEKEDRAPTAGRVSAPEETVPGTASGARGHFCCSFGNVTDDVIAKHIAEQKYRRGEGDEDFKADG